MLNRDWRKLPSSWAEEDEDPVWVRGPFLTYEGEHEGGVVVFMAIRRATRSSCGRIGLAST